MTNLGDTTGRWYRAVRWAQLVVPVAVGVLVSSLAAGYEAAAAISDVPGPMYEWKVVNYTDQPLRWVKFKKWEEVPFPFGSPPYRSFDLEVNTLPVGSSAKSRIVPESSAVNHTSGWVCYDGTLWQLPGQATSGTKWRDVFIFAGDNGHGGKQLIATPQGAKDDRGMVYHGDQC